MRRSQSASHSSSEANVAQDIRARVTKFIAMRGRFSPEVATLLAMVLFVAAYLTFSNNFHFEEPKPTTIDRMFAANAHGNVMSSQVDQSPLSRPAPERKSPPFASGHAISQDKLLKQIKEAKTVWPPQHGIFLGDTRNGPPAPQTSQPVDGCIYEKLGAHNWRFCLPAVLTISCINCGTTSLGAYLDGHAHLSVGTKKEHKFFVMKCADERQGPSYECDTQAYQKEFPSLPKGCEWNPISGEASMMKRDFKKVGALQRMR